ncbi:MAG: YraN family protein [Novosphingobium sp.]|jgi:putative endonuclease|nr:YraN family protein [Novosphingobium sp.]
MSRRRAHAERRGRRGETLAAWYLRLKGWRILARRVKTSRGEVDLIARRGATVAFVEVKWRNTAAGLELAIDARRLRRVAAAAEAVAPRFVRTGDVQRIDVLLLAPRRIPRHIVNAWMP